MPPKNVKFKDNEIDLDVPPSPPIKILPPPPPELDFDEQAYAPENPNEKIIDEMEKMREQFNNLQQLVYNKGLDVGIPRRIRDDINKIIGQLNKIDVVWDSKENRAREDALTDKIEIAINKGNLPSAVIYLKEQVASSKGGMEGVRMFLNILTIELNNLSRELEKQGK